MAELPNQEGQAEVRDDQGDTKVQVRITDPGQGAGTVSVGDGLADTSAEPAAVGPPSGATSEEIEELRKERDGFYERLLRKTAEFENYRKRVERERREQADYAAANLLRSLLPLVDSLERALGAEASPEAEPYRKGVEIIHRQMLDLLQKNGVTPIEAVGTEFDPHLHEAVIHEVSPDHPEGQVIAELQRGYRLGERLLRPALVKVAKA